MPSEVGIKVKNEKAKRNVKRIVTAAFGTHMRNFATPLVIPHMEEANITITSVFSLIKVTLATTCTIDGVIHTERKDKTPSIVAVCSHKIPPDV